MYPGYFALVMATGIISIACKRLDLPALSDFLLWVGVTAHAVLIGLYVLRSLRFPARVWQDLTDARSMFAYFTFVAANGTLGARFFLNGNLGAAWGLWGGAACAWLLLTYFTVGMLIFRNVRPLAGAVNGSWLVAIVGTQSVAILSTQLAARAASLAAVWLTAAYMLWAAGVMLYALFISFIFVRLGFAEVHGADLSGPYWINMGAMAISTVAGATLYAHASQLPALQLAAPVLYGLTWGLWAWGTWWLPLLFAMGIWKHFVKRVPLAYDPALWSMVFPLGMYTVATLDVSVMIRVPWLGAVAHLFLWIALAAWFGMFLGLLGLLSGWLVRRAAPSA